jgi:glycine/D-amino acid oxidase-like deaminating enzyme
VAHVMVIGGGAIGGAIAWRLASADVPVRLIECDTPGASSAAGVALFPSAQRHGNDRRRL